MQSDSASDAGLSTDRLPAGRQLVLVGGGHSHALLLRMLGLSPVPGLSVTLVSNVLHVPYSGMIHGLVSGIYAFKDCHIDVQKLCAFAKAQLVVDEASGLDPVQKTVRTSSGKTLHYDTVSIDIGSAPQLAQMEGAIQNAIPIKPIPQFLDHWNRVAEAFRAGSDPVSVVLVGGGAAGVEICLALRRRVLDTFGDAARTRVHFAIVDHSAKLLEPHAPRAGKIAKDILTRKGVVLYLGEKVAVIGERQIRCESGLTIKADCVICTTKAAAAPWLKSTGLKLDAEGFIAVNAALQSVSHPAVFAAGDTACMIAAPRPKAGVFAVRQAPILFKNLIAYSTAPEPARATLHSYRPQRHFLSLISFSDRSALATRGNFAIHAGALWTYKDWLDRKFMAQFAKLPAGKPAALN